MNLFLTDSTWTGKALLIAGAVAIMLVGDENLRAAPDQASTRVSAQWTQYEPAAPATRQTIVRAASSNAADGTQFNSASQQRWVF
jgi:hypothetical protein